jgi:hypothetical protein
VVAVRTSWRSWFWNLVLFVITLTMTAISVAVTVQEVGRREPFGIVVFAGSSIWLCWLAGRALLVGVYARPQGIVIRNPGLTRTIPWTEVDAISGGGPTTGPSSIAGATTAVVHRLRPGATETEQVVLNAIGGYGLSPVRPSPAEGAIADLNAYLQNWRQAQSGPNS